MVFIFCDVGIKNFCYIIVDKAANNSTIDFLDFEIKEFNIKNLIRDVLDLIEELYEKYIIQHFYIELQSFHNARCSKIETVLATYLTEHGLSFSRVRAQDKLKKHDITTKNYVMRKKEAIRIGEIELQKHSYGCITEKINSLKKKDDFYDCVLMAVTELI
jgi:hypothetical protein